MAKHWRIFSNEGVHVDLFVGDQSALVWDTGYGFGSLREVISSLTEKPLTVVNSHGHLDHVNGNYQFKDCTIYMNSRDLGIYTEHSSPEWRRKAVEDSKNTIVNRMTGETANILPEGFDEDGYINAALPSVLAAVDGQVFELGEITLRIVELPGHTLGCIGLIYEQEKVLFSGDNFSPTLWLFSEDSVNLSEYIQLLEKTKTLPIEGFYTAHRADCFELDQLDALLETARALDFEQAFLVPNMMLVGPDQEVRVFARPGYSPRDMQKPGFACIFVAKEKL